MSKDANWLLNALQTGVQAKLSVPSSASVEEEAREEQPRIPVPVGDVELELEAGSSFEEDEEGGEPDDEDDEENPGSNQELELELEAGSSFEEDEEDGEPEDPDDEDDEDDEEEENPGSTQELDVEQGSSVEEDGLDVGLEPGSSFEEDEDEESDEDPEEEDGEAGGDDEYDEEDDGEGGYMDGPPEEEVYESPDMDYQEGDQQSEDPHSMEGYDAESSFAPVGTPVNVPETPKPSEPVNRRVVPETSRAAFAEVVLEGGGHVRVEGVEYFKGMPLVLFLRSNPTIRLESEVLKFYTAAEIKKNVDVGHVLRKKGKLIL